MKEVTVTMRPPPDAVFCECGPMSRRRTRQSLKVRRSRDVVDGSANAPAERRPRSFHRFLATIMRKMFDTQTKNKDSTNWADPVVSNLNETPINKFNEYGGVKLQNPPSRTSSQHPSPRLPRHRLPPWRRRPIWEIREEVAAVTKAFVPGAITSFSFEPVDHFVTFTKQRSLSPTKSPTKSSSGIDFDGHSLNGSVKGAALDTSSGSLSSESSIVNKTVRGRNATRDVLDSIVSSDKVRLVDTLQQSLLDEQYRPAPVRVSTQIPAARQPPRKKEHVAPWYFPQGKPVPQQQNDNDLRRVSDVFRRLNGHCRFTDMAEVCEAANLPLYWKKPIFEALTKGENRDATQKDFTVWWRAMTSVAHDAAARFVYTVTGGARTHVVAEDLASLVMDVIHTHPGLAFYRSATEFHDKYCDVVITRIFWNVAKTWSGKITTDELRKSDFLDKLFELQKEDDINQSLRYFSYEHFYVVYCKFWDIDTDHDLKISKEDLAYHGDGAIPKVVIDRIFSGAVRRKGASRKPSEFMDLCDFTRFLLADEDKKHPTSIEYWFRVLDQDGDGIVTLYDLEFFHKALQDKMAEQGIESMSIRDVACLLIDTICPEGVSHFKLSDLKRTSLAPRFLNSLVNWRKFYSQETNECSDSARIEDESGQELTDWDRFCIEEYEVMMEQDGDDVDENFTVTLDDDDAKVNGTIYLNGDDESHRSFHDIL